MKTILNTDWSANPGFTVKCNYMLEKNYKVKGQVEILDKIINESINI